MTHTITVFRFIIQANHSHVIFCCYFFSVRGRIYLKGSLTPNKEGRAGSVLMQFIDSKMYSVKLLYLVSMEWIGSCSIGLSYVQERRCVWGECGGTRERSQGWALLIYP